MADGQIEVESNFTIRVLREPDVLWCLEGDEREVLVGLLASTEHLTVGKVYLQPGQRTDVRLHGGDQSLYLLEGTLNIHLPDNEGQRWFELNPRDGFYIPEGAPTSIII